MLGQDSGVTSLWMCSEPEWVAVGAGRTDRAEYPGGMVVPFRRSIRVMGMKEITRRLGQPSCPDLARGHPGGLGYRAGPSVLKQE